MNTYLTYISKHNLNHENQVNLLMIPKGETVLPCTKKFI